jgi:hypothetical protein
MNKLTTLALAGLVAVAASAVASDSRMAGFGASSAFIADVQDIWTLPAVVASNKNATYFEMGDYTFFGSDHINTGNNNDPNDDVQYTGNAWGGVHAEVGPGVLGIWVGRPASLELSALWPGWTPDNLNRNYTSNNDANGRVDLLYGFAVSEKVDLGISLTRANSNEKYVDNYPGGNYTETWDATDLAFGLGVDVKEVAIFKLLQAGLTFDSAWQVQNEKDTATNWEGKASRNISAIGLRVGADVAGDEGKFGRLEVGLKTGGGKSTYEETNFTPAVGNKERKTSGMLWNLGYALGKSSDKGMGLAGLMLEGASRSQETDAANSKSSQGNLTLALSTAGEAKVKEWLTARAGLSANLYQADSTESIGGDGQTDNGGTSNSSAGSGQGVTTISTGLSMNFGDLTIDGVLNQDVLFTGTYLISGLQETLFSKVSATWGW